MKRLLLAVAAIPAFMLAAFELSMLVLALSGDHPLWKAGTLNVSEAAALRDAGEVARLIERGDDPNLRRPVRAGFLDSDTHEVTPLEAATFNRRPELVRLLMMSGVRLDGPTWVRLRCYAQQNGREDVAAELDSWEPPGAALQCSGVERAW